MRKSLSLVAEVILGILGLTICAYLGYVVTLAIGGVR